MRRTALVADVDARRCHVLPSSKVKVFIFFPHVLTEMTFPHARCLDPATRMRSKNAENDDFDDDACDFDDDEGEERKETR